MAFDEDGDEGALNGTTPVVVVDAPASGKRIVKHMTLHNKDSVDHVVTIKINSRIIWKGTLEPGDTWEFGDTNEVLILSGSKTVTMESDATATTSEPEWTTHWGDHT